MCKEFSYKNWAVSSVKDILRKIDTTNSISRNAGSSLDQQLISKAVDQWRPWLNALFCCLWRNVEASCHEHFVVFSRN